MTAPSQYLRDLREQQASRRLGVAKVLRDNPDATNIELAKIFDVTRDTIACDRKANMEQLHKSTLDETEAMRFEMVQRLEALNKELELHRKDGKLPVGVIHEALLVTRSIIELLGVRRPVTERLEVRKSTISFRTFIGKEDKGTFEMTHNQLALKAGESDEG